MNRSNEIGPSRLDLGPNLLRHAIILPPAQICVSTNMIITDVC